jgi:hypothetical protein
MASRQLLHSFYKRFTKAGHKIRSFAKLLVQGTMSPFLWRVGTTFGTLEAKDGSIWFGSGGGALL